MAKALPYIPPVLVVVALNKRIPICQRDIQQFFSDAVFEEESTFSGLDNFKDVSDNLFWTGLKNNLIWSVACVGFELVLGMLIALLLNLPYIRLRGLYRALILLPWATTPL